MRTSDVPSDRDAHDASVPAERRERKGGTSRHQGKSGCWPLTVFKLGGSLAYAPELRGWLKAIEGLRGAAVIVPGGGPFADAVRLAQARMGYDDAAAHDMAMMAMAQFGRALVSLERALRLADTRAAIKRGLEECMVPVWAPNRMAEAARLPGSWEITSDSLAAWLAAEIGAKRLVMIKHCDAGGPRMRAEELAARGIVDPLFPRYLSMSGARAYLAAHDDAPRVARDWPRLALPEIVATEDAYGEA